jgi:hypothetical protein
MAEGAELMRTPSPGIVFWTTGTLSLRDVTRDPDLTLPEKRAILASWASDSCAVENAPGLRRIPGSTRVVGLDEILEALRMLDRQAGETLPSAALRRVRRAAIESYRERQAERSPSAAADATGQER